MIQNNVCPYCGIVLGSPGNADSSRSVEHMIPNAAITKKRNKDEGDFYCCRKCNQKKSNMDDLIGKSAKMQSKDNKLAADTMIVEFKKKKKRFVNMLLGAKQDNSFIKSKYPFDGIELIEYIEFLGKGQFFKKNNRIFVNDKKLMLCSFYNKEITLSLIKCYTLRHGTNPFFDLQKNVLSEVINNGESIIYSQEYSYLFFIHDYIGFGIKILEDTKNNRKLTVINRHRIYLDFKK